MQKALNVPLKGSLFKPPMKEYECVHKKITKENLAEVEHKMTSLYCGQGRKKIEKAEGLRKGVNIICYINASSGLGIACSDMVFEGLYYLINEVNIGWTLTL